MGSPHRLSAEDLSAKYSLGKPEASEALENFDSGRSMLLGFSGKIGAGKDSVAPLTFEEFTRFTSPPRSDSFGANLKDELNQLIAATGEAASAYSAAKAIAADHGVSHAEALRTVEFMAEEIDLGLLKSAHDRTQGSRSALQYWATEVRRAQDPLYWVKPVIQRTIEAAAEGTSTQLTDIRFLTEVWGAIDAGGWTVRLDVTIEEQRRRILARDGIEISAAAKRHSSETELDDFDGFTVRVQTDDYSSATEVARAAAHAVNSAASVLF